MLRKGTSQAAFTLLELLVAVSIFAVVLGAINAVFFSALRLRNRAAALMDKSVPVEHALSIIRKDLLSLVPPGSGMIGQLQTIGSTNVMVGAAGPAFFCSSGLVDQTSPWADIQRVTYALVESTNRHGQDLVRYADRNLLATSGQTPSPQFLLNGVESIVFAFYDGSQWREYWDSTTEQAVLPLGIRVQIKRVPDEEDPLAASPPVLELVVPVMVMASTNSASGQGGQP
jgi:type II secretion system protein J